MIELIAGCSLHVRGFELEDHFGVHRGVYFGNIVQEDRAVLGVGGYCHLERLLRLVAVLVLRL